MFNVAENSEGKSPDIIPTTRCTTIGKTWTLLSAFFFFYPHLCKRKHAQRRMMSGKVNKRIFSADLSYPDMEFDAANIPEQYAFDFTNVRPGEQNLYLSVSNSLLDLILPCVFL